MSGPVFVLARHGRIDDPGITITLPPNRYLIDELWFDPDPATRTADIPPMRRDAVTVLAHELGHGLGFHGRLYDEPPRDDRWGTPKGDEVTTYDDLVTYVDDAFYFVGEAATKLNGGERVKLADRLTANNDYHHLADANAMMTGQSWDWSRRYYVTPLDLAILQDLGVPILPG